MNKKNYSIGYKDKYNIFSKVWEKGYTKKFISIEEAKKYIFENKEAYLKENINIFKIMQGWKIIEEIII